MAILFGHRFESGRLHEILFQERQKASKSLILLAFVILGMSKTPQKTPNSSE